MLLRHEITYSPGMGSDVDVGQRFERISLGISEAVSTAARWSAAAASPGPLSAVPFETKDETASCGRMSVPLAEGVLERASSEEPIAEEGCTFLEGLPRLRTIPMSEGLSTL